MRRYSEKSGSEEQGTSENAENGSGKTIFDVRFTSDGTKNARQNCYETDISRTLSTSGNPPEGNYGGITVLEGSGQRPSHKGKGYSQDDVSFTLNTSERQSVVYSLDRESFNCGRNFARSPGIRDNGTAATLNAQGPGAVSSPPNYIVRRLTPKECAKLHGFPENWCAGLEYTNPSKETIEKWMKILKKSEAQTLRWLKKPHSDTAEYKMWVAGVRWTPCPKGKAI